MNAGALARGTVFDEDLLREVLHGLAQQPKTLPCKLFYDSAGAALFEQIMRLPEYYLTRSETEILQRHGAAIAQWVGSPARVVEFGSGSGEKTRLLLQSLGGRGSYLPIDIAHEQLAAYAHALAREFPQLEVTPLCADYTRPLTLPRTRERTVIFFPGSTIGNFTPREAHVFLQRAAQLAGPGGGLLIGVDLRKDKRAIERAYNDAAGVTARFNLNMLAHINRVLAADFDTAAFVHHAHYDEALGRIEMRLVSKRKQQVHIGRQGLVELAAGEAIVTEYSYKYSLDGFRELAESAGFRSRRVWLDGHARFSLHAFESVAGQLGR